MKTQKFTLAEIAQFTNSECKGDPDYLITGFADLESAGADDISFLSNPKYTSTRYLNAMQASKAGAIFVAPSVPLTAGKNFLITPDPSRAFQMTIERIKGDITAYSHFQGIHPSAVIHETAKIGANATIGPHAVIDAYVVVGEGTFIGSNTYIGPYTTIGCQCTIHPNVSIREECTIGDRVVIQPGATIGSCGFGYTTNAKGEHERLTHIGTVTIGDDVEIGANAAIDRSRFSTTHIDKGSKIDNLVAIGHNVRIGKHNIVCAQSGIAGSTSTGSHVVIAGQCGVDGHIKLGNGVIVTAQSGVTKSLQAGKYGGHPAIPLKQHNRQNVLLKNLESYVQKIRSLEEKLEALEARINPEQEAR